MFNKFDVVWLLTRGGPLKSTEHLPVLAYRKAFVTYDVGMGAAISSLSFLMLAIAIFVYLRIFPLDTKGS
jgi:multiple sugar transport system permease protein